MALTPKFKKAEIDEDFDDLNKIINKKLSLIQSKYGKAIILVQTENTFNVGYIIDQASLEAGSI